MQLIYLGSEIPSNRTLLTDAGVTQLGVAFHGLRQRVKQEIPNLLTNFPDGLSLHALPGVSPDKELSEEENLAFAADYELFLETNRHLLSSWTEFDSVTLGPDWIRSRRESFYDNFDEQCFRPIWHFEHGVRELENLSDKYPHVAIPLSAVDQFTALPGLMRQYANKFETRFHLLSAPKPEVSRAIPVETMYTATWQAPMRRGETIVWDGGAIHRYPAKMKDEARSRHRQLIENIGLDFQKIQDDVPSEVTKLALWSLQQLESGQGNVLPMRPVGLVSTNSDPDDGASPAEVSRRAVDNSVANTRNISAPVIKSRNPEEKGILPSFGMESRRVMLDGKDGTTTITDIPVITSGKVTIRSCNTCFVASNCPAFTPDTECAFDLPIEVKTQDQLKSMLQAMIEMQGSRIAFARYAEEVNGGYPDITVSKEMDRLFKFVESLKKLEENREFVKVSVERQASGGVLSALFGDRAGEALQIQPTPEADS